MAIVGQDFARVKRRIRQSFHDTAVPHRMFARPVVYDGTDEV